MKKFVLAFLGILVFLCITVFLAFQLSPRPGVWIIRQGFKHDPITNQQKYKKVAPTVETIHNINYTSSFTKNSADIYYKKGSTKPQPTIFWLHGGGFVAGDKEALKEYATYLVNETGYTVVSLDYEVAPDAKYPSQVKQTQEAYQYFKEQEARYPMIDFSKVMFGGDSAGAQIAAQFVLIQTNPDYRQEMDFPQAVDPETIKGAVLYCGPYDLKQILKEKSDDRFVRFFVQTVGWALSGQKDWKNWSKVDEISLVDHLTKDYPPVFVTDGNAYSFQEQGIAFVDRLNQLGVPTESLFYNNEKKAVNHEYQFDFTDEKAWDCFDQTVDYMRNIFE